MEPQFDNNYTPSGVPQTNISQAQFDKFERSGVHEGAAPMGGYTSMYDQRGVDPWMYSFSLNPNALEADRAENQSTGATLIRGAATIGLDILKGIPGTFLTLGNYLAVKPTQGLINLAVGDSFAEGYGTPSVVDELFNPALETVSNAYHEAFKIYNSQRNIDNGIFGSISTTSGVANDMGNAISFMVGGRLMTKIIQNAGVGEAAAEKLFKMFPKLAPKDIITLAASGERATDIIATLVNSIYEADLEGQETYKNIKDTLYNQYLDELYNEDIIRERAIAGKNETTMLNMALLSLTNGYQQVVFRGGYADDVLKKSTDYFKRGMNAELANVEKKGLAKVLDYGIAGGKSFGTEGFLEEGFQQSIQNYEKAYATNETKDGLIAGIGERWAGGLTGLAKAVTGNSDLMSTDEAEVAKAMLIGGIVGLGGGLYSKYHENQKEEVTNSDAYDVYKAFKGYSNAEDILTDEYKGMYDIAEDGTKTINPSKAVDYLKNAINNNVDDALSNMSVLSDNPILHRLVQEQAITKFAYRIYNNSLGQEFTSAFLDMLSNAEGTNFYKENKAAIDEKLNIFETTRTENATFEKLTNQYNSDYIKQLAYLKATKKSIENINVDDLNTIDDTTLPDKPSTRQKLQEEKEIVLKDYDAKIAALSSKEGYKEFTDNLKKARELHTIEKPLTVEDFAHNYATHETAQINGQEVQKDLASEKVIDLSKSTSVGKKIAERKRIQQRNQNLKNKAKATKDSLVNLGTRLTQQGNKVEDEAAPDAVPANKVAVATGEDVNMAAPDNDITVTAQRMFNKDASMGRVVRRTIPFRDQLALRIGNSVLAKAEYEKIIQEAPAQVQELFDEFDRINNTKEDPNNPGTRIPLENGELPIHREVSYVENGELVPSVYIEKALLLKEFMEAKVDYLPYLDDSIKNNPVEKFMEDFKVFIETQLTALVHQQQNVDDEGDIIREGEIIQDATDIAEAITYVDEYFTQKSKEPNYKSNPNGLDINNLDMNTMAYQYFKAYTLGMALSLYDENLEIDDAFIDKTTLQLDAIEHYTKSREDINQETKDKILAELEEFRNTLQEQINAKGQETAKRQLIQSFTQDLVKQVILKHLGVPPAEAEKFQTLKGMVGLLFDPRYAIKLAELKDLNINPAITINRRGLFHKVSDLEDKLKTIKEFKNQSLAIRKLFDSSISVQRSIFNDPIDLLMTVDLDKDFQKLIKDNNLEAEFQELKNIFTKDIITTLAHIDPAKLASYNANAQASSSTDTSLSTQQQLVELYLLGSLELYDQPYLTSDGSTTYTYLPRLLAGLVGSGKTRSLGTIMTNMGTFENVFYSTMVPAANQLQALAASSNRFKYVPITNDTELISTITTLPQGSVYFVDEAFRFNKTNYTNLLRVAEAAKVKLVLVGDPSQNNNFNDLVTTETRFFTTPAFTATYRTSHPGIAQAYKGFMFNPNMVTKINALANTDINAYSGNTKGSIGFTESELLKNFIRTNLDKSTRTKLILVDTQAKKDAYEALVGTKATVMLHKDAQGIEREEVYVDIDYTNADQNEAMYTALGRAKQFVAFVHPTVTNAKPRDVLEQNYADEYTNINQIYNLGLVELSQALNGVTPAAAVTPPPAAPVNNNPPAAPPNNAPPAGPAGPTTPEAQVAEDDVKVAEKELEDIAKEIEILEQQHQNTLDAIEERRRKELEALDNDNIDPANISSPSIVNDGTGTTDPLGEEEKAKERESLKEAARKEINDRYDAERADAEQKYFLVLDELKQRLAEANAKLEELKAKAATIEPELESITAETAAEPVTAEEIVEEGELETISEEEEFEDEIIYEEVDYSEPVEPESTLKEEEEVESSVVVEWPSSIRFKPSAKGEMVIFKNRRRNNTEVKTYLDVYALSDKGELVRVGVMSYTAAQALGLDPFGPSIREFNGLPQTLTKDDIIGKGITDADYGQFKKIRYRYNSLSVLSSRLRSGLDGVTDSTTDQLLQKFKEAFAAQKTNETLIEDSIEVEYLVATSKVAKAMLDPNNIMEYTGMKIQPGMTYAKIKYQSKHASGTVSEGIKGKSYVIVPLTPRLLDADEQNEIEQVYAELLDMADGRDINEIKAILSAFISGQLSYEYQGDTIVINDQEDLFVQGIINKFHSIVRKDIVLPAGYLNWIRNVEFGKAYSGINEENKPSTKQILALKNVYKLFFQYALNREPTNQEMETLPTIDSIEKHFGLKLVPQVLKNKNNSSNEIDVVDVTNKKQRVNFLVVHEDDTEGPILNTKHHEQSDFFKKLLNFWSNLAYANSTIGGQVTKVTDGAVTRPKRLTSTEVPTEYFLRKARENGVINQLLGYMRAASVGGKGKQAHLFVALQEDIAIIQKYLIKNGMQIDFDRDLVTYNKSLKSITELTNKIVLLTNIANADLIVKDNGAVYFLSNEQYAEGKYTDGIPMPQGLKALPQIRSLNIEKAFGEVEENIAKEFDGNKNTIDWRVFADALNSVDSEGNSTLGTRVDKRGGVAKTGLTKEYVDSKTAPNLKDIQFPALSLHRVKEASSSNTKNKEVTVFIDKFLDEYEATKNTNFFQSIIGLVDYVYHVTNKIPKSGSVKDVKQYLIDYFENTTNSIVDVERFSKMSMQDDSPIMHNSGMIAALKDKTTSIKGEKELLSHFKSINTNPKLEQILKKLIEIYKKTGNKIDLNIVTLKDNQFFAGLNNGNTIYYIPSTGQSEIFLHELTHALFNDLIRTNAALQNELITLAFEVRNNLVTSSNDLFSFDNFILRGHANGDTMNDVERYQVAAEFLAYAMDGRMAVMSEEHAKTNKGSKLYQVFEKFLTLLKKTFGNSVRSNTLQVLKNRVDLIYSTKVDEVKSVLDEQQKQNLPKNNDPDILEDSIDDMYSRLGTYSILNDVQEPEVLNSFIYRLFNNPNWTSQRDKFKLLASTIDLIAVDNRKGSKAAAFKNIARILYNSILTVEERKVVRDTIFTEKLVVPDHLIIGDSIQDVHIIANTPNGILYTITVGPNLEEGDAGLVPGTYVYNIKTNTYNFVDPNTGRYSRREGVEIEILNSLVKAHIINESIDSGKYNNEYNVELVVDALAARMRYHDYANVQLTGVELETLSYVNAALNSTPETALQIIDKFYAEGYKDRLVAELGEELIEKMFGSSDAFFVASTTTRNILQTLITGSYNKTTLNIKDAAGNLVVKQVPISLVLNELYKHLTNISVQNHRSSTLTRNSALNLISTAGIILTETKEQVDNNFVSKWKETSLFSDTTNSGFKDTKLNFILNLIVGTSIEENEITSVQSLGDTNDVTDYISGASAQLKLYFGFLQDAAPKEKTVNGTITERIDGTMINFQHAYLTAIELFREEQFLNILDSKDPIEIGKQLKYLDKISSRNGTEKALIDLFKNKLDLVLTKSPIRKDIQIYSTVDGITLAYHQGSFYLADNEVNAPNIVDVQSMSLYEAQKNKNIEKVFVTSLKEAADHLNSLVIDTTGQTNEQTLTELLHKTEALDFIKLLKNNVASLVRKDYSGITIDVEDYYKKTLKPLRQSSAQGSYRDIITSRLRDLELNKTGTQVEFLDSFTWPQFLQSLGVDMNRLGVSEENLKLLNVQLQTIINIVNNNYIAKFNSRRNGEVIRNEELNILKADITKKILSDGSFKPLLTAFESLLKTNSNGTLITPDGARIFRYVLANVLDDSFMRKSFGDNPIVNELFNNNISKPSYFVGSAFSSGSGLPLFRENAKNSLSRDFFTAFLGAKAERKSGYTHFLPSQGDKNKAASFTAAFIKNKFELDKYLNHVFTSMQGTTIGTAGINLNSYPEFLESLDNYADEFLLEAGKYTKNEIKKEDALDYVYHNLIYNYIGLQGLTGEVEKFVNDENVIKRLSGLVSPGYSLYVGLDGASRKFNVLHLNDAFQATETLFSNPTLKDQFEILKNHISKTFTKDAYDIADGQGIITESRFKDLQKGLSSSYKMGSIFKPMYFDKTSYLKYSAFVLTSQLAGALNIDALYKAIQKVEERHPNLEIIFNSAAKRSPNKAAMTFQDLLNLDLSNAADIEKLDKSISVYDNFNYKLQSNPNQGSSKTAMPTQAMYFLTLNPALRAKAFDAWSKLHTIGYNKHLEAIQSTTLRDRLLKAIPNDQLKLRSLIQSGVAPNSPLLFEQTVVPYLSSMFRKIYSDANFNGGQLVLASSIILEGSNQTLDYKVVDGKLIAEVIVPSNMLSNDEKAVIKDAKEIRNQIAKLKTEIEYRTNNGLTSVEKTKDLTKLETKLAGLKMPTLLGFRIPTTGLHSLVYAEVKDYHNLDNKAIFTPLELSLLHGSDYDVDKLSMLKKALFGKQYVGYDKDGKFNYEYTFKTDDINEQIAYYKNVVFQSIVDVISDTKNSEQLLHMFSPISTSEIIEAADRLGSKEDINIMLPLGKLKMVQAVGIGRTATGVFANAAKIQAYLTGSAIEKINFKLANGTEISYTDNITLKYGKNFALIDAFINSSIDNLKELSLSKLRINLTSLPTVATMLILGETDIDKIFHLIAQYNLDEVSLEKRLEDVNFKNNLTSEELDGLKLLQRYTEEFNEIVPFLDIVTEGPTSIEDLNKIRTLITKNTKHAVNPDSYDVSSEERVRYNYLRLDAVDKWKELGPLLRSASASKDSIQLSLVRSSQLNAEFRLAKQRMLEWQEANKDKLKDNKNVNSLFDSLLQRNKHLKELAAFYEEIFMQIDIDYPQLKIDVEYELKKKLEALRINASQENMQEIRAFLFNYYAAGAISEPDFKAFMSKTAKAYQDLENKGNLTNKLLVYKKNGMHTLVSLFGKENPIQLKMYEQSFNKLIPINLQMDMLKYIFLSNSLNLSTKSILNIIPNNDITTNAFTTIDGNMLTFNDLMNQYTDSMSNITEVLNSNKHLEFILSVMFSKKTNQKGVKVTKTLEDSKALVELKTQENALKNSIDKAIDPAEKDKYKQELEIVQAKVLSELNKIKEDAFAIQKAEEEAEELESNIEVNHSSLKPIKLADGTTGYYDLVVKYTKKEALESKTKSLEELLDIVFPDIFVTDKKSFKRVHLNSSTLMALYQVIPSENDIISKPKTDYNINDYYNLHTPTVVKKSLDVVKKDGLFVETDYGEFLYVTGEGSIDRTNRIRLNKVGSFAKNDNTVFEYRYPVSSGLSSPSIVHDFTAPAAVTSIIEELDPFTKEVKDIEFKQTTVDGEVFFNYNDKQYKTEDDARKAIQYARDKRKIQGIYAEESARQILFDQTTTSLQSILDTVDANGDIILKSKDADFIFKKYDRLHSATVSMPELGQDKTISYRKYMLNKLGIEFDEATKAMSGRLVGLTPEGKIERNTSNRRFTVKELGTSGEVDFLFEHDNYDIDGNLFHTYTLLDAKNIAQSEDRDVNTHYPLHYGKNVYGTLDNSYKSKAYVQLGMYALMLKHANPDIKFKDILVLPLGKSTRFIKENNRPNLGLVFTALKLLYADNGITLDPNLLDPNLYEYKGYQKPKSMQRSMEDLLLAMKQISSQAQATAEHDVSNRSGFRNLMSDLYNEYKEMTENNIFLNTNSGIEMIPMFIGSLGSQSDRNVTAFNKAYQRARMRAIQRKEALLAEFRSYLDIFLQSRNFTPEMINTGNYSVYNELYFTEATGEVKLKKVDDLTDKAAKDLVTFLNKTYKQFHDDFSKDFINYNPATDTFVSSIEYQKNVIQDRIEWHEGWIPKTAKGEAEYLRNNITGSYRDKLAKYGTYWYNKHLTYTHEKSYERMEIADDMNIVLKYMNENMNNRELMSLDIERQFDLFTSWSIHKQEMEDVVALGKTIKAQTENSTNPSTKNVAEFLDKHIKLHIKQIRQNEIAASKNHNVTMSATKIAYLLSGVAGSMILSFNIIGGVKNIAQIFTAYMKNNTRKSFSKMWGTNEAEKYFVTDNSAFTVGIQKALGAMKDDMFAGIGKPSNNKLMLMFREFGFSAKYSSLQQSYHRKALSGRSKFLSKLPMMLYSVPEEILAMGVLYNGMQKLQHNGKSLYDNYDVVDNKLVWKGGERFKDKLNNPVEGITGDELMKLKYITEVTNGTYREDERSVIDYYIFGSLLHAFKRTLFSSFRQQFRGTGYQHNLGNLIDRDGRMVWEGNQVEGRWFTLLGIVRNILGHQGYEAYNIKNLAPEHKIALLDTVTSLLYFALIGTLSYGLLGDDDDKISGQIANSFNHDLANFVVPYSAIDITPVAFKYTSNFGTSALNAGFNGIRAIFGSEDAYTKEGYLRGGLQFQKLLPIFKQVAQYERHLK